ncbi:MAG: hypothetical protein AAFX40_19355, partial [Cyanobacteria bacterium J06639_1]
MDEPLMAVEDSPKAEGSESASPTSQHASSRQRQRWAGRLSLRAVLTVPFLIQIGFAVGLTGVLSWYNGQRTVADLVAQLQDELSNRIESKLAAYLDEPHRINQLNRNAIAQDLLAARDLDAWEQHVSSQLEAFPSVNYVQWGNRFGEF